MDDRKEKLYDQIEDSHSLVRNIRNRQPDWVRNINSICATCQHAQIMRRKHEPDPTVYCHEFGREVPPDIAECSQHYPVNKMSLRELFQEAKILDKNWWEIGVGFKPPKKDP